jgi:quercetin dioxygenase-like cupin family protein
VNPKILKNIVEYQEGAVVSKEILKTASGTVTLFAFDVGQGLSEHTAPFEVLANIIDGEAEVSIAGTPHTLTEGHMIILPANRPHALKAHKPFKMLLVMLK